jgi:hypothetical protein
VIDLDNIWKWVGFQQKYHAKYLLEKKFQPDIDYKILLPNVREQTKSRGGHNKETILLTVKAFKLFCLKAGTTRAEQIHEYYVNLEETLQEVINEESNELKLQLEQKTKELKDKDKKTKQDKELLREKTIIEQFPDNVECVYYGYIDNTNNENEKLLKFGQSNNLKRRVTEHKKLFINFRLVNAFRVENKQLIENDMKTHSNLKTFRRNIVINETTQIEILALNGLTITELDTHIKNIICANEFTKENYAKLIDENIKLKEENILLKEENEILKVDNKKMLRNYKIHTIKKTEIEITDNTENDTNKITNLLKRISRGKDGLYHINDKTYTILAGTRQQVWDEEVYRTSGGLTKDDLLVNKHGNVVSKTKFISSKQDNHLAPVIEKMKKNRGNQGSP